MTKHGDKKTHQQLSSNKITATNFQTSTKHNLQLEPKQMASNLLVSKINFTKIYHHLESVL